MYGRKFVIQNRLGQPYSSCSKEIYFVKLRAISKYKPPGGLYLEGQFNGVFFALRVWGAYIWSGLYMEGLIFGILRYLTLSQSGWPGWPVYRAS